MAIVVIVLAPIQLTDATAGLDYYTHDTYFVVAPRHAILGFALLCGLIAGSYYLGDRVSGHRLSKGLALSHFLFWMLTLIISWSEQHAFLRAALSGKDPSQSRLILAGPAAAMTAFVIGGLLFLINFGWAITRRLRSSSSH